MPVQTWAPGQTLTAVEMKTITDMLPYLATQSVSLNPCVAGTFYRCQPSGSITLTLPTPTAGAVIGFKLDAAQGNTAVIQHNASESLYGPDIETSVTRGVTTYTLQVPDDYIVLQADGTNWHEIAHGILNGPTGILSAGYNQSTTAVSGINAKTTQGQTNIPIATVTVQPGRRIKVTAYSPQVTSTVAGDAYELTINDGATTLQKATGIVNEPVTCTWVSPNAASPSAGSHPYWMALARTAGTGTLTLNADASRAMFILVEDIGGF